MSPALHAVRTGLRRGVTEFGQQLAKPQEYVFDLLTVAVLLVVLYFLRGHAIPGMALPLASFALPSLVGALVAFNTVTAAAFAVSFEREDGTLLRSRAAPYGVVGYLTGQVVRIPLYTVLVIVLLLMPGLFLFEGMASTGAGGWLTLVWVLALGLLATLPIGMVLGALASNPRTVSAGLFLVNAGLIAISGIFVPITALPGWVHPIAQIFPFYWLGLGMRHALLPGSAAAAELGGSWHPLGTVAVLAAWSVAGLVLAPAVLRRMTRRTSGASVEAGRHNAAQRLG
jgi:ABC-2 type transport system permease protein